MTNKVTFHRNFFGDILYCNSYPEIRIEKFGRRYSIYSRYDSKVFNPDQKTGKSIFLQAFARLSDAKQWLVENYESVVADNS